MNKIKRLLANEAIMYVIFGVLTTLINIISYEFFNTLGIQYLISNGIAFVLSIIFAFVTNKVYVFKSYSWQRDIIIKEGAAFVTARVITFLMDMALMVILVEMISVNDFMAKCLVNVIVIVLNYVISKWVVFKKIDKRT